MLKRVLIVSIYIFFSLQYLSCHKNIPQSNPTKDSPFSGGSTPTGDTPPTTIPRPECGIKKNVMLDKDNPSDQWLEDLEIKDPTKAVVVNGANSGLGGGGGIDGALSAWAKFKGAPSPWNNNPAVKSPIDDARMTTVAVGRFAICTIDRSVDIYLAVGPQASQVNTLAETCKTIADLFYEMLLKAHNDGKETIVLCAISTAIFARGGGKEKNTGKLFS